jgi:hypothetical protein
MRAEALAFFIILLIMVPISTVILIVSMFISSALGGGIDFGDARVAIPKAVALILLVNTVGLTCAARSGYAGFFMTGPIWLFGLMGLFRLDIWEARLLVTINWGLNFLARWVVMGVVLSLATGQMGGGGDGDDVDDEPDQISAVQMISQLGGKVKHGDAMQQMVTEVDLSHSRVTDRELHLLHEFPKLVSLNLSDTKITDAGLHELEDLTELQLLTLTQTGVTNRGVKKLLRTLPNVKIIQ